MLCSNCGKELVGIPAICEDCGTGPEPEPNPCPSCGSGTHVRAIACPKCGAALEATAGPGKKGRGLRSISIVFNIVIAVVFVSTYLFLASPPAAVEPVVTAASNLVVASVGYTAIPLDSIIASPPVLPRVTQYFFTYVVPGIPVNTTEQLTIYAVYKEPTTQGKFPSRNTATASAGRFEDVTDKAVFQSSNTAVVTVTADGLIQAVASGAANITVSYTAIPGSANLTAAAEGKIPITVTVNVPAYVR
ncbi:MAG: zinc ribbon domain-containing protein [Dehalococcoidales bacterium]|nr:zinc ribbon domain-containing protein [Dehalococcoidales bacterium]MDP7409173.1 zinc ribbon domain-containing protein [Dehalococcoidales bacterium]